LPEFLDRVSPVWALISVPSTVHSAIHTQRYSVAWRSAGCQYFDGPGRCDSRSHRRKDSADRLIPGWSPESQTRLRGEACVASPC
jgi:hypothetical protein